MAHDTCFSPYQLTHFQRSSGTLMLPTSLTMIAKGIQVLFLLLARAPHQAHLTNINYLQKARLKVNLLDYTTRRVTSDPRLQHLTDHCLPRQHEHFIPRQKWICLSSKCSKHIKAKYFFICHYHNTNELNLQYCPTDQMWADVLTKPLQGYKFCMMRAFLMNCPADYAEILPFTSSDNPSTTPLKSVPHPSPSSAPSISLTKPRISLIKLSLQGCVETQLPRSSCTKTVLRVPPSPMQKVTWKDVLMSSKDIASSSFREAKPYRVLPTPQ
jgi:hypothetical protein